MNKKSFEEIFDKTDGFSADKKLILPLNVIGKSMKPLLREHRDTVLLKKYDGNLKKYDIALFKRANGSYALHRVVKICDSTYSFCGDNQVTIEKGITDEMIVAVAEGIYRDEKYIPCERFSYKLYSVIRVFLFPIRCLWFKIKEFFKVTIIKIKRK